MISRRGLLAKLGVGSVAVAAAAVPVIAKEPEPKRESIKSMFGWLEKDKFVSGQIRTDHFEGGQLVRRDTVAFDTKAKRRKR